MGGESVPAKKVVVLGSSGSIGTSALKVARDIPGKMEIVGLAANRSIGVLEEQVAETGAKLVGVFDEGCAEELRGRLGGSVRVVGGEEGLCELATLEEADMVLIAIVGTAGLRPALAAIEAGKDIAVASKEILVMAGEAVMAAARRKGVQVLPVDREHNAIFQCLEGREIGSVRRLILTASGGPFRTLEANKLEEVTLEQALKHPTWEMGQKITIDSATLFNKGLEMIEARWLFEVEMAKVDVVVHPQSIVHSMVEFVDGSVLAQLSHSDMCFPIQYAVTWPERTENTLEPLDLAKVGRLDFEAPRAGDFPALGLAREAGERGGTLAAVLNAANEVAVERFVRGEIGFSGIWGTVERVMGRHEVVEHPDLAEILEADAWARRQAVE
ncbi:MAG: 1-deoxy-D-xylulose-5-phosphate reductoisomerase [Verrucomicrobiales bacterium]|nr:1-deoxy-D-xylulose-5-phosphate reductoisomerase [Verrucomicrobiales bacterium]